MWLDNSCGTHGADRLIADGPILSNVLVLMQATWHILNPVMGGSYKGILKVKNSLFPYLEGASQLHQHWRFWYDGLIILLHSYTVTVYIAACYCEQIKYRCEIYSFKHIWAYDVHRNYFWFMSTKCVWICFFPFALYGVHCHKPQCTQREYSYQSVKLALHSGAWCTVLFSRIYEVQLWQDIPA